MSKQYITYYSREEMQRLLWFLEKNTELKWQEGQSPTGYGPEFSEGSIVIYDDTLTCTHKKYGPTVGCVLEEPREFLSDHFGTLQALIYKKDNMSCCSSSNDRGIIDRMSDALKKMLDESLKAQCEAGYRDECLNLTDKGKEALAQVVAEDYAEELQEKAEDELEKKGDE